MSDGFPKDELGNRRRRWWKKADRIEIRRLWADARLVSYIQEALGFPGARQGAMVENVRVETATGEASGEHGYLLTGLPPEGAARTNCWDCSVITGALSTVCLP